MKKFVVTIVAAVVMLIGAITVAEGKTATAPDETYRVQYTTMTVHEGQTLSEIAHELWSNDPEMNSTRWNSYKDLLDEIFVSSGIKNVDYVQSGTTISVPYLVTNSDK